MDTAEQLAPGHGLLDLGLIGGRSHIGAGLSLEARVSRAVSAYAEAEALWDFNDRELEARGMAGMRVRW